jgi:phosphoglycerol transferase MdoB-like AlkP superfamily enzyme
VRGVLTAAIDDVDIVEQARLKSPVVDVWGVSDKNLFLEANEMFRAQKTPFFAMIQTSGNHRPYTIPDEDQAAFQPPTPTDAQLEDNGFISLDEYRAFAYLDWCVGRFMAAAKKEAYFKNTIFAFIGDHGIIGVTGPHLPKSWHDLAITQGHTPFLVYSPGHVAQRRIDHWAQQVDVLPTLASLAGIGYRNTTLGRDLLDPQFDASRVAFEFQFTGPRQLGVLVGTHMLVDRQPPALFDIESDKPSTNLLQQQPVAPEIAALQQQWGHFPAAYGNAALYLQTHNHKLPKAQ